MGNELCNIVYVDIHRFQVYNCDFGHDKGDVVIERLMEIIEAQNIKDLKRIGGNHFTFVVDFRDQDKVCKEIALHTKLDSNVYLNFAIGYASEDRKDELMYLLKVASNSGGGLILRLP